jgi:penicillin-insensitive murein endopeptidase
MRPSRNRRYGHPELTDFIRSLGRSVHRDKLGIVLVGDLGQPRGGPAPSGHSSHQTGLDADIWYWFPKKAAKQKLSAREREQLEPRAIVSSRTGTRTASWSPHVEKVLRLAVADERVERIFVNPLIKRELCESIAATDRAWLRKLRPWWGHDWHFHVRLRCPSDSAECVAQESLPEGDGCSEIEWWLRDDATEERTTAQKRYQDKVGALPELPARCAELVD